VNSDELPRDPALDHLFRALTADGDTDELAGRDDALTMFLDRQRTAPRRRLRLAGSMRMTSIRAAASMRAAASLRMATSMRMAVAVVVIIAGIAGAAYAAVLPAPVQHVAYHLLDGIGAPDAHRAASPAGAAGLGPSSPAPGTGGVSVTPGSASSASPAPPNPGSTAAGCQCRDGQATAGATAPGLALSVTQAQIPVGGDDVLSGLVLSAGQPAAGVQVRLSERLAGQSGWRQAGSATTGSSGEVSLTVSHLTSNASFRLTGPEGAVSTAVPVTVIPPVYLRLVRHPLLGIAVATARAGLADVGDIVILQELSGGTWVPVSQQVLGADHRAYFTVPIPRGTGQDFRVELPGTITHGSSASSQVWLARR